MAVTVIKAFCIGITFVLLLFAFYSGATICRSNKGSFIFMVLFSLGLSVPVGWLNGVAVLHLMFWAAEGGGPDFHSTSVWGWLVAQALLVILGLAVGAHWKLQARKGRQLLVGLVSLLTLSLLTLILMQFLPHALSSIRFVQSRNKVHQEGVAIAKQCGIPLSQSMSIGNVSSDETATYNPEMPDGANVIYRCPVNHMFIFKSSVSLAEELHDELIAMLSQQGFTTYTQQETGEFVTRCAGFRKGVFVTYSYSSLPQPDGQERLSGTVNIWINSPDQALKISKEQFKLVKTSDVVKSD